MGGEQTRGADGVADGTTDDATQKGQWHREKIILEVCGVKAGRLEAATGVAVQAAVTSESFPQRVR